MDARLFRVEVFLGAAPLLETRLVEGLLAFGDAHPHWRFAIQGADMRYTPEWLRRHRVDGALVLIDATDAASALDAAGIPWVHLLPPGPSSNISVTVDDAAIGRMGAEMFLASGFRKFAYCVVGTSWSTARFAGFRSRLVEAGLDCTSMDARFDTGRTWTLAANSDRRLRRWLAGLSRVTAIMAGHDALANRLVDICLQEGIRVPDDLAILGVGNHDILCRLSPVPISSIDCAVPELAMRGAGLLDAMLHGEPLPGSVKVLPRHVVERGSTEVLGFESDLINRMVRHIREHVRKGLTVEELAQCFPVSRRTLTRRFQEYVGHSPGEEIRRTRLHEARRMLEEGNQPLDSIARACGYTDLPHMNRTFRKAFGQPPGAFIAPRK